MPYDDAFQTYLEEHYAFSSWRSPATPNSPRKSAPDLAALKMPGWRLIRATESSPRPGITVRRGMWEADDGGAGAPSAEGRLLSLDIADCASPAEARRFLLELLGDMQGPVAERDTGSLGEVAFRLGGDTALLFARGNLVVRFRNGGRQVVSLRASAQAVDAVLTGDGGRPARRAKSP